MKNNSILDSDYFYNKCIWAVGYCSNPRELTSYLFNILNINRDRMVSNLNSFLDWNYYFFKDKDKGNLHLLVRFLRNGSGNERFFDLLDKKIDRDDFSLMNGFISSEYEKRYAFNLPNDALSDDDTFNRLKLLFVNDMDVLITHSNRCDARTFNTRMEKYTVDYMKYIGSVNKIINECPQILNNELFVYRVKLVLNNIEKNMDPSTKKIYTLCKKNFE